MISRPAQTKADAISAAKFLARVGLTAEALAELPGKAALVAGPVAELVKAGAVVIEATWRTDRPSWYQGKAAARRAARSATSARASALWLG